MNIVAEGMLTRKGVVTQIIQGVVEDTVEHAVNTLFDQFYDDALLVVGDADIFVTKSICRARRGGREATSLEIEQSKGSGLVDEYTSLYEEEYGAVERAQIRNTALVHRYFLVGLGRTTTQ